MKLFYLSLKDGWYGTEYCVASDTKNNALRFISDFIRTNQNVDINPDELELGNIPDMYELIEKEINQVVYTIVS